MRDSPRASLVPSQVARVFAPAATEQAARHRRSLSLSSMC